MSTGGFSKTRLSRVHDVMAGYIERGEIPGLVMGISRKGETHVDTIGVKTSGGKDAMQRDSIFRIASLSKPITAAAAMILVEESKLRLDDSINKFLPELAHRKVLRRLNGPLDDTAPAQRSITLRDLLTFRMGFGLVLGPPDQFPIVKAMADNGIVIGPKADSPYGPDEWIRRLGTLPLMYQPGEKWLYHSGADVLGVLIARASGKPFETFLRERLFEPLGMKDTSFTVPAAKLDRLPPAYMPNATGKLDLFDDSRNSQWAKPPVFPSGGAGLVSTVDDYLSFSQMMLNKGKHGNERILSRASVELMTTDQLTPEQKAGGELILGNHGWGFGMSIVTKRDDFFSTGTFGWDGGTGACWRVDPAEGLTLILMTQRLMTSASPPPAFVDFWTSAYQAIDD